MHVAVGSIKKWTGNNGSWKAGLCPCERSCGLATGSAGRSRGCATANEHRARRSSDVDGGGKAVQSIVGDGEPAAGIEQVGDVFTDEGQLQPFHWTIICSGQRAFIIKGERGSCALGQSRRKHDPDSV